MNQLFEFEAFFTIRGNFCFPRAGKHNLWSCDQSFLPFNCSITKDNTFRPFDGC